MNGSHINQTKQYHNPIIYFIKNNNTKRYGLSDQNNKTLVGFSGLYGLYEGNLSGYGHL